jgi:oxygen-independent coproporphyrinogen-3 oxidase
LDKTLGIYIHIPFCDRAKCPYCDFYSVPYREDEAEEYTGALCAQIKRAAPGAAGRKADTVYFGGGTPSLIGNGLNKILDCVAANFALAPGAEITAEANPGACPAETLQELRAGGFNRLSLGMQSAQPDELRALGRRHTPEDVTRAFGDARDAGFGNISLDLMLAVPGQTRDTLAGSLDFISALAPEHVSAYLLTLEPGTLFYKKRGELALPDDDGQAEMYAFACRKLEEAGFAQYEISNFSRPGFESRHNLKYWDCREYLGFGPGAHSFFKGRRYYYPRSLRDFMTAPRTLDDGAGGSLGEYVMLRLRLAQGLGEAALRERYGRGLDIFPADRLAPLVGAGLVRADRVSLKLTRKGMLVSNSVIGELIEALGEQTEALGEQTEALGEQTESHSSGEK